MKIPLQFTVNGEPRHLLIEPQRTLLEVLREDLRLTGTKRGCDQGECGACTVLLDGRPVNSCLVLAASLQGAEVLTIEGLAQPARPADLAGPADRAHPIQRAFVEKGAIQCGFCTPGMILAAKALLDTNPEPTEMEIRAAMAGNICRCTGYIKIIDAIRAAAGWMKDKNLLGAVQGRERHG